MNWLMKTAAGWLRAFADAFAERPHPVAGTFIPATNMYMGHVTFKNKNDTLRVSFMIQGDISFLDVTFLLFAKEGSLGSDTIHFNGNAISPNVCNLVIDKIYQLIDHEVGFLDTFKLDRDWGYKRPRKPKEAASIHTNQVPQLLAQALQFTVGGEWEADKPRKWTEELDNITQKQLGQEVGYSTSFWITCKKGDPTYKTKWGVSVNFTVISGSSDTSFDSATGDWDFSLALSVQRASDNSWTPMTPYPLFMESVGDVGGLKTIQEAAEFVKASIDNSKRPDDDDGFDDDDDDSPELDPTPAPSMGRLVPASKRN